MNERRRNALGRANGLSAQLVYTIRDLEHGEFDHSEYQEALEKASEASIILGRLLDREFLDAV